MYREVPSNVQVNQDGLCPIGVGSTLRKPLQQIINTRKLQRNHFKEREFLFLPPAVKHLHLCHGSYQVPQGFCLQGRIKKSPWHLPHWELVPSSRPAHPGKLSSVFAPSLFPENPVRGYNWVQIPLLSVSILFCQSTNFTNSLKFLAVIFHVFLYAMSQVSQYLCPISLKLLFFQFQISQLFALQPNLSKGFKENYDLIDQLAFLLSE